MAADLSVGGWGRRGARPPDDRVQPRSGLPGFEPQLAAMPLCDGARDGQPEPEPALAGTCAAEKALAQCGAFFLTEAGAVVLDVEAPARCVTGSEERDRSFCGGVGDRVAHQVAERLAHQRAVGHGGEIGHGGVDAQVDALCARQRQQVDGHFAQQRLQVELGRLHRHRVAATQGQQLLGAARGAGDLGAERIERGSHLRRVFLAPRVVGLHLQRGEVGAQLVRGVVEELPLLRDQLLRARHLLVDCRHQRPHLGGQVGLGDAREVVAGARAHLARQPRERPQRRRERDGGAAQQHRQHQPVAQRRTAHESRAEFLPRARALADLDQHAAPGAAGRRAVEVAAVGREPNGLAEVGGVVEGRHAHRELGGRSGQVCAAELDQPVGGRDAEEHLPARRELEELEHRVRQFDGEPARGGRDVGIDGLERAEQRAVVGGVGGCQRVVPRHPQLDAGHDQQGGEEQQRQPLPEARAPQTGREVQRHAHDARNPGVLFAKHRGAGSAGPQTPPPAQGEEKRHEEREARGSVLI